MTTKFPLTVNQQEIRDLKSLQANFNIDDIMKYFSDGLLLQWLRDRYYDEEADKIEQLKSTDENVKLKLCEIFSVSSELALDSKTFQKLQKLKTYTKDSEIIKNVNKVAFNQEDLSDLLDNGENKIYLCDNNFIIPLRLKNKTYVGVKNAVAIIRSNDIVDFESLRIKFENVQFDDNYKSVMKESLPLGKNLQDRIAKALQNGKSYRKFQPSDAFESFKKAAEYGSSEAMKLVGRYAL